MAFPPAHFLVGVGAAELVRAYLPIPRWPAWLVAGALAVSPDFDLVLGIALGRGGEYHGTFTHSFVAVAVVGLVAWMLAGRRWGALATAAYGTHLLVDLLDDRGRTNVLLMWPFSLENSYAIARLFPTVPFRHGAGVWGAATSLLEPAALGRLVQQTAIGAVMMVMLLLLARAVRVSRETARS